MAIYTAYNGAARALLNGSVTPGSFTVRLYTAFTFNPAHTAVASIVATEVANGNGYTTGGQPVNNVLYDIVETNGCAIRGDNLIWTASNGSIDASHALVSSGSTPIGHIDFEGAKLAPDGTAFVIAWPNEGIIKFGPVVSGV